MGQELKKSQVKHCYACIQWEGQRTYYPEKQIIKVDINREGKCLVHKKEVKGSSFCEQYFPLR
jgi:hypothetical protein